MQTEDRQDDNEFGLGLDICYVPKEKKRTRSRTSGEEDKVTETVISKKLEGFQEGVDTPPQLLSSAFPSSNASPYTPPCGAVGVSTNAVGTTTTDPSLPRRKTVYEIEREEKLKALLQKKTSLNRPAMASAVEEHGIQSVCNASLPPRSTSTTSTDHRTVDGIREALFTSASQEATSHVIGSSCGEEGEAKQEERRPYFQERDEGRGERGNNRKQEYGGSLQEDRKLTFENMERMRRHGRGGGGGRSLRARGQESSTAFTPSHSYSGTTRREGKQEQPDPRSATFRLNQRRMRNALVEVDPDSYQPLVLNTALGSTIGGPYTSLWTSPSSFSPHHRHHHHHRMISGLGYSGRDMRSSNSGNTHSHSTGRSMGFRGGIRGRGNAGSPGGDRETGPGYYTHSNDRSSLHVPLQQYQQQQHRGNGSVGIISSRGGRSYHYGGHRGGMEGRGGVDRRWGQEFFPVGAYSNPSHSSGNGYNINKPLSDEGQRGEDVTSASRGRDREFSTRGKRTRE